MNRPRWCEHLEICSKYTTVKYYIHDREVFLRVQTWMCPECGVHGAATEIVQPSNNVRIDPIPEECV